MQYPPMRTTAILLNLIILAAMLSGCGPSQRERTIQTALTATNAARDGFVAWDSKYQLLLVERATSVTEGSASITQYRLEREQIVAGFTTVYRAIAIAAVANDGDVKGLIAEALKLKTAIERFIEARR